ncbi:2-amino-4-hydroxy-6-hydroxymethyldihydropteridine diphosphokinase [Isoptericola sp. BMS4]|uniref:2-amino-4-hydroxy-6- hydroxymethyldihydropteridine diphosphokinase n=1 Tax=Isoptericola sp. BMS4 TaxID=2527875 RepID=UPI00196B5F71|nr:2-amino-4-hydroxy-6-hydroxymethyldihydropteridine diphosphokinase [Isoptericola sp. BMS4]
MTFAAAVPDPRGRQLDQIRLDGVTATGHHGVLPHERAEGQVFSADVVLHLDTRAAASSDDLGATVSYADVARDVHDVLAGSPADLVETVAERIAAAVLAHDAVHTVDVRVHKPQAPIEVPFDDVAVVVRRDRTHAPSVDAPARPAEAASPPAPEPAEAPVAPALGAAAVTAAAAEPAPEPAPEPGATPEQAPVPPVPAPVEPEEPAVDPLDVVPEHPVEAVLALGANLGDAQVTLREAVTDIDRLAGVQVTDVSPLARTGAVGGPDQPDYLNAVLVVRTTLAPVGLLDALQDVEEHHGRVREKRWGPRTLDIDIVQYGTLTSTDPDLELPHPRAHERAFVLVPWAEIAPDAVLGGLGGGIVGQLAATAPDRAGIRWLALDWLTGPTQSTGQVASSAASPAPSAPVPQAPDAVEPDAPRPDSAAQPVARPPAPAVPEDSPEVPWAPPEDSRSAPWSAPEDSSAAPWAGPEAQLAPEPTPEPAPSPAPEPAYPSAAEPPAPHPAPEAYPAPAPQAADEPGFAPDPWPAPQQPGPQAAEAAGLEPGGAPAVPSEPVEPHPAAPSLPDLPDVPDPRDDVPDPAALPPVPGPAFDVPTGPEPRTDPAQPTPPPGIIDSVPRTTPAPHAPVPPAPDQPPAAPEEPEALRPYAAPTEQRRPVAPAEPSAPLGDAHRPVPAEPRPATPVEPHPPVPPAPPETYPPFGGEPAQLNPFAPFGEPDPEPPARPEEPGHDAGDERER